MDVPILTPSAMRAAEQEWFAAGHSSFGLMERAAHAVASAAAGLADGGPVLVACGPGNNGGDGWLAAAMLREFGADVRVAAITPPAALSGDAALAAARWGDDWQGRIEPGGVQGHALVVDALFGIGLARPPEGPHAAAIEAINAGGAPVLAVDIASGVDAATGVAPGVAARAAETLAFHALKPGHVLQPGRGLCGRITVADIGLPFTASTVALASGDDWAGGVPVPHAGSHKYTRGGLAVWSGPEFATGASRLAARAALRAGAGAVWLAGEPAALRVHAAHVTAVMLHPAGPQGWAALLADAKVSAALVGPGGGSQARTAAESALACGKPVVLDADALTAFQGDAADLARRIAGHRRPVVLTPHAGELARLLPGAPAADPVGAALAAARHLGAVVVLKGATTIVAAPDGRATLCADAPAWLATIGTGDVLAGLVGSFVAQRMDAVAAAVAAVRLHADAARRAGPWMVAEDLEAHVAGALGDAAARSALGQAAKPR